MISLDNTRKPWELLDIDFVWQFRNKDADNYTTIGNKKVTIPELCSIIKEQGLLDPLVLRLYTDPQGSTLRLEEGNHRIQILNVFMRKVPVIVEIANTPIGRIGNGIQLYRIAETLLKSGVTKLPVGTYLPSEIFNYGS